MAGIEPTRDYDYLRLKLRDLTTRIQELENGDLMALLAASYSTPYGVIRTGMLVPTFEDVPGEGIPLPGGYFWSEGSTVSRVDYARLWNAMGQPDTGDGDNTFTLPNTTGRAPYGAGGAIALQAVLGSGLNHTHSVPDGGSHGHSFASNSHQHGINSTNHSGITNASYTETGIKNLVQTVNGTHNGSHAHGGSTDSTSHDHGFASQADHNHGGSTGNSSGDPIGGFGVKWLVKF